MSDAIPGYITRDFETEGEQSVASWINNKKAQRNGWIVMIILTLLAAFLVTAVIRLLFSPGLLSSIKRDPDFAILVILLLIAVLSFSRFWRRSRKAGEGRGLQGS